VSDLGAGRAGPRVAARRIRRSVAGHPRVKRVRRIIAAARLLRPGAAFVVGELRGGVRRYRLTSGIAVVVRHRSRDIDVVVEVLGERQPYEPPAELVPRLADPLRILDLGGNIGLFGAFALARFDVRELTSFEPDPVNAEILARTIALNHCDGLWRLRAAAASNAAGELRFLAAHGPESRMAEAGDDATAVPAIDLFALDGRVDLLKIDIEGGEWALLCDPRLPSLGADVIVLEWHWRFAPEPDPHAAVVRRLRAAGYEIVGDESDPAVAIGVVWAARG
jgi:FkbM family methyltransferase